MRGRKVSATSDISGGIYVLFRLGDEEYGIGIEKVRSIIRYEEPTVVPRAPASIQGVVNLRGKVIPVLDLTKRMQLGEFAPGPAARIVVAEGSGGMVGLAVDAASEVVTIPEEDIKPAPEGAVTADTEAMFAGVAEVGEKLVILLELDAAVPDSEYAQVGSDRVAGED